MGRSILGHDQKYVTVKGLPRSGTVESRILVRTFGRNWIQTDLRETDRDIRVAHKAKLHPASRGSRVSGHDSVSTSPCSSLLCQLRTQVALSPWHQHSPWKDQTHPTSSQWLLHNHRLVLTGPTWDACPSPVNPHSWRNPVLPPVRHGRQPTQETEGGVSPTQAR